MNWHEFETMKREQRKDFERAMQMERLARRVERRPSLLASFDLRCWVSSHVSYMVAAIRHWERRIRRAATAGEPGPVLTECS